MIYTVRLRSTLYPAVIPATKPGVPYGVEACRATTIEEARIQLREAHAYERSYPKPELGIYETELDADGRPVSVRLVEGM